MIGLAAVVCALVFFFFRDSFGLGNIFSSLIAGVLLLTVVVITNFSLGSVLLFVL